MKGHVVPMIAASILILALMVLAFHLFTRPAHSQGSNFRFSVSGYGGNISSSPAYASFQDCQAARAALNQGYPMTACLFTSGS